MLMSFFSSIITFQKFVCFLVEFLVSVLFMKLDNFIVNSLVFGWGNHLRVIIC